MRLERAVYLCPDVILIPERIALSNKGQLSVRIILVLKG